MKWHLEVLPPVQRAFWDSRIQAGFPGWVLYGGTALALRLGHRESVDFDFFSSQPIEPLVFKEENALHGEVLQVGRNTLTLLHEGVKLSFFGGLTLNVVSLPDLIGACRVASLDDLAACKLAALVNRVELKDYLDIAALLQNGISWPTCWDAQMPCIVVNFRLQRASKALRGLTRQNWVTSRNHTGNFLKKPRSKWRGFQK